MIDRAELAKRASRSAAARGLTVTEAQVLQDQIAHLIGVLLALDGRLTSVETRLAALERRPI